MYSPFDKGLRGYNINYAEVWYSLIIIMITLEDKDSPTHQATHGDSANFKTCLMIMWNIHTHAHTKI